eukprot:scaffold10611_cov107-Isochrysis_galbana.AAC.1
MLEPFRQRYGLYENTQAMLWLAVVRTGGKPLDGITSECPEGLTGVTGAESAEHSCRRAGVIPRPQCAGDRATRPTPRPHPAHP